VEQDDKGWDARKRAYCLKIQPATGSFARNLIYSTKPCCSVSSLQTPFTSVLWLKCHFWFLPCFAIKDVPQMRQIQLQERPFSTLAISTILFETVSNPNGIHFCELRRMNIPR
ncbi:TPA: hypothetical protein ACPYZP_005740, partial [Klebsiella pneumoniae]